MAQLTQEQAEKARADLATYDAKQEAKRRAEGLKPLEPLIPVFGDERKAQAELIRAASLDPAVPRDLADQFRNMAIVEEHVSALFARYVAEFQPGGETVEEPTPPPAA